MSVVASQKLTFHPTLYNTTFSTPLLFRRKVGSYWDKGVVLHFDMLHRDTREVLVHNERVAVKVDGKTGRATAFTPEILADFQRTGVPKVTLKRDEIVKPPADVYVYKMQCSASDTDFLGHVNQSHYLRYCTDAAYEAGQAGFLSMFPPEKDPAGSEIERVSVVYRSQSYCGDHMEVHVWEDKPRTLRFQLQKVETGTLVCIASFLYNSNSQAKL